LETSLGESLELVEQVGDVAAGLGLRSALVGGGVRDLLIGRPLKDIDLVIEGDAPSVGRAMVKAQGGRLVVHEAFGTATWQTDKGDVDLSTARTEIYEHPGALPTVEPASLEDDLFRRDFTVNAMAIHLHPEKKGELMDLHGGQQDLEQRVLRILHPQSFDDDATRGWRGARYSVRYGLSWEPETATALHDSIAAGAMTAVTLQRQGAEWDHVLGEPDIVAVLGPLRTYGLLASIHPELGVDVGLVPRLQGVLTSGKGACYGRLDGLREALWLGLAMGMSTQAREQCREFASGKQGRIERWSQGPERVERVRERLTTEDSKGAWGVALKGETGPEFILLHSLGGVTQEAVQWWLEEGRNQRSSVSASGLMDRGVPQGPQIGRALEAAQRCAWEGGSDEAQWLVALESARHE